MKYVVYGTTMCGHCVRAKNALRSRKLGFLNIDINEDAAGKAFILGEGHKTVPQIYAEDALGVRTYIGGADDLMEHLKKVKD